MCTNPRRPWLVANPNPSDSSWLEIRGEMTELGENEAKKNLIHI